MSAQSLLPVGCTVLERGWLSSNNIVFTQGQQTAIVDTGYVTHSDQTLSLLRSILGECSLDLIVNTHLHSDHCGGNALLQSQYPQARTLIPPGHATEVAQWDEDTLSYTPTGQSCPRFDFLDVLQAGQSLALGKDLWEIHAAPGHDPHSVILFEPQSRTLISADALWENGFGVVFQELEGIKAFDEVAATLDVIEQLKPSTVIPGHGHVFTDVSAALSRARTRLEKFIQDPIRHANYGGKVLIKYKLLEWQHSTMVQLQEWIEQTPYFHILHQRFFIDQPVDQWLQGLLSDLERSGALEKTQGMLINRD
ncbi:MBL fold metallo-hydrolase [Variovorax sp. PCZ-1]|uniref:MBL fold metallo-hydrolase n=1 Tax=Variovorax sp. PCZ-1 TaxID=2835533 RepID=UPI001BCF09C3|nr:MBL fold metallo-hydrolase [Variovorax sp. PCZ-1]MBS7808982.1 MBL fold metallo-hydrolase [Variovorax sp. PCZ-1]